MGAFANALSNAAIKNGPIRTILSWRSVTATIFERLSRRATAIPKMAVLERVNVAPRQFIALIDVEGEKLLVSASQNGSPRFFRLTASRGNGRSGERIPIEGTVE